MPSVSLVIARAPEDVWDLIADVTRMSEWSPETTTASWCDGVADPAVGARFKGGNKRRLVDDHVHRDLRRSADATSRSMWEAEIRAGGMTSDPCPRAVR